MGQNRDRVLEQCNPAMELGFSLAEYKTRLQVITGITYYICTLLFKEDVAELPAKAPRQLVVTD